MPRAHRARRILRRRLTRAALAGMALGLCLVPNFGCGREFFRHWADQDVAEAVFEKSRDPRWRMERLTTEPPAQSRFAQPYNIDRQPAPPDDAATQAVSPTPQLPYHRLLVPAEGTGYRDSMEMGRKYISPPPEATLSRPTIPPVIVAPPQPPVSGNPSPFNPPDNSGTKPPETTPNSTVPPPNPMPDRPAGSPAGSTPPLAKANPRPKDSGVLLTTFQTPGLPATTPDSATLPAVRPGQDTPPASSSPPFRPAQDAPIPLPGNPSGNNPQQGRPGRLQTGIPPLDPGGVDTNTVAPPRPELAGGTALLEFLNPVIVLDEAQAAGFPANSRPYVVGPAECLQYALINNRSYQYNIEQVYISALAVTASRFGFQPNFYAGFSPSTAPTNNSIPSNPSNLFNYRTKEAVGGQLSTLNIGSAVGVAKYLSFGGRLAAGFANTTVFNFLSARPTQPTVSSVLPLTFTQPFLRGGGRAVTLEGLTQAERSLLYAVRTFARYRQSFVNAILTSGATVIGNDPAADPTPGYLNILNFYQNVENDRNTIAYYERLFRLYEAYVRGGASSGISQIQVDQLSSQIQQQRGTLLNDEATLKTNLDNFKLGLGLPPDLPMIIDRSTTGAFPQVFRDLIAWARRNGDPEELDGIILGLPKLETIVIDGRPLFEYDKNRLVQVYAESDKQQEFLLAAERVALENRLDLMNQRATLYDVWRQLAVQANGLQGIFTVSLTNQIQTPSTTSNPFAFSDQAKTFGLSFNSELPLIRVNERNGYRTAILNYQRAQRLLQSQEDDVKQAVRQEIYNLISVAENYQIAQVNLKVNIRQRDFATRQIFAPATSIDNSNSANVATQTNNLIQSITGILNIQKQLLATWVNYQSQRMAFYRDLGLLPFDEWEAFYEFFPANSATVRPAAAARNDGPAAAGPAVAPPEGRP